MCIYMYIYIFMYIILNVMNASRSTTLTATEQWPESQERAAVTSTVVRSASARASGAAEV